MIPEEYWWLGALVVPAVVWLANWYRKRLDARLETALKEQRQRFEATLEERRDEREHRQAGESKMLDYAADFLKDINAGRGEDLDNIHLRLVEIEKRLQRMEMTANNDAGVKRLLVIIITDIYEKLFNKLPKLYFDE